VRIEAKHRTTSLTELPDIAIRNRDYGMELAIRQLVHRLPEKQRRVVDLFYFQGWPIREIAALLRIRDVTVRSRLHSARRALAGPVMHSVVARPGESIR
jgi:RNA polymerase sigma factor (sigma-70 family)